MKRSGIKPARTPIKKPSTHKKIGASEKSLAPILKVVTYFDTKCTPY